jgi:DNA-binding GntR family transcriptional regulator
MSETSLDTVAGAPPTGDLAIYQRTLPEQVADAIVRGLAKGSLKPGERLYEPALVERLGVSRAPIREALRILEAQGIVEGVPQRGLSVCRFDAKRRADVYEIRHALERITIPKAAILLRAEPRAAERLERLIDDMALHAARDDRLAMNEADLAFHGELCRLAGNAVLVNLWRGLSRQVLIILALETTPDVPLSAIHAQHVTLLAVMRADDPAQLDAAIESHIAEPSKPGWPGTVP